MDLKNKNLEKWLSELSEHDKMRFPENGKVDYSNRYKTIADHLNHYVHPHVNAIATYKDGGFLTDHGPDHIKSVIMKASDLINTPEFNLEPYEVYFLLMAIHFHDVGHIKDGRYQHEISSEYVIKDLGSMLGKDGIEKRHIYEIAQAHGGKININKDKIGELLEKNTVRNYKIRPRLLAAILRLADELSEDRSRAARYLLETGGIPKSSEIYHRYAYSLHSVTVDLEARAVEMSFEVKKDEVLKQFGKNNEEVYLLDEIYERTLKTYIECKYCMRFLPLHIQITSIIVKIEFIENEEIHHFRKPISYRLTETGYPEINNLDIFNMCPNELRPNGEKLTGIKLKELLECKSGGGKND